MNHPFKKLQAENPWTDFARKIEENKFKPLTFNGLAEDRPVLDKYNCTYSGTENLYRIHHHILPYHYTGNIPSSKVLLLALNPGYVLSEEKDFYFNPELAREVVSHLTFQSAGMLSKNAARIEQSDYWHRKLSALIKTTGSEELVSRNISTLQFNPYHTIKFKHISSKFFGGSAKYLPSQEFGFKLVRASMDTEKVIVVLRGTRYWKEAVPGLSGYKNLLEIKNKRQPYLTEKNMNEKDGFARLVSAITK